MAGLTEHEAQLSALKIRCSGGDDQLRYHPNWMLVERYTDEGITEPRRKSVPPSFGCWRMHEPGSLI